MISFISKNKQNVRSVYRTAIAINNERTVRLVNLPNFNFWVWWWTRIWIFNRNIKERTIHFVERAWWTLQVAKVAISLRLVLRINVKLKHLTSRVLTRYCTLINRNTLWRRRLLKSWATLVLCQNFISTGSLRSWHRSRLRSWRHSISINILIRITTYDGCVWADISK